MQLRRKWTVLNLLGRSSLKKLTAQLLLIDDASQSLFGELAAHFLQILVEEERCRVGAVGYRCLTRKSFQFAALRRLCWLQLLAAQMLLVSQRCVDSVGGVAQQVIQVQRVLPCLPGKQSCSGHLVLTRLQSALELKRIFVINMWHDFPGCFSSS